jgi:catechol 2,3-dioxygenase-like lactoylglutathione lyase family enzyme
MSQPRVDIGIIVRDEQAALRFYRDTLALDYLGPLEFPHAVMHRLAWGASLVKLTYPKRMPEASNPPGGLSGGSGLRYITLTVSDLDDVLSRCAAAGYRIAMPRSRVRPGIEVGFVEDPDGNWVEFLEETE